MQTQPDSETGPRVSSPTPQFSPPPATAVCPFCALHCDDVALHGIQAAPACARAMAGLARWHDSAARPARIDGKAAPMAEALAAAQRLVKRARQPLVSGLGADVDGVRAALDLARSRNAWFDPAQSEAQAPLVSATQRQGVIRTTFTEVRNRADLVIVLGSELLSDVPRFIERVVAATRSVDGRDLGGRRVLVVGATSGQLKKALPGTPAERLPEAIKCGADGVPELLQALAARLAGHTPPASRQIERAVETLAEAIAAASYTAFVWQSDAALGKAPAVTTELLFDLIARLNQTARAAGLPVGGAHGAASAMAVTTWQTGFPSRVRFQRGKTEYNPTQFAWPQLLTDGAPDLVIWVDAFHAMPLPDCGDTPVLLIGGNESDAERATVRLPAGVPGLDHDGQLIRGDQVISLTLRADPAGSGPHAPPAAEVLRALHGDVAEVLKGWL